MTPKRRAGLGLVLEPARARIIECVQRNSDAQFDGRALLRLARTGRSARALESELKARVCATRWALLRV